MIHTKLRRCQISELKSPILAAKGRSLGTHNRQLLDLSDETKSVFKKTDLLTVNRKYYKVKLIMDNGQTIRVSTIPKAYQCQAMRGPLRTFHAI